MEDETGLCGNDIGDEGEQDGYRRARWFAGGLVLSLIVAGVTLAYLMSFFTEIFSF